MFKSHSNFNVFSFTETWLSKNIRFSELGFNNYNVNRYDRNTNTSSLFRGGGVLIAVDN